jgi:uncharacterized protein YndB with AHSA1/START domain
VTVALPREEAFRLFTERIGNWWPLVTHTVFHEEAVTVTMEPRVGGRLYEATADGRTSDWGVVTAWEPVDRVSVTWHPGYEDALATLVEVTFNEAPDGGTVVDLLHSGWEAHGDQAQASAANYPEGWALVLERFVNAARLRT